MKLMLLEGGLWGEQAEHTRKRTRCFEQCENGLWGARSVVQMVSVCEGPFGGDFGDFMLDREQKESHRFGDFHILGQPHMSNCQ